MNKVLLIFVIIFMTMLGSLGGFFFKRSSSGDSGGNAAAAIAAIIKNKNLYIGGFIYVVSALLNVWVLKYMPLSIVMPMTAITYIWTMILSRIVLKEKITAKKMIGIALIIVGALIISI